METRSALLALAEHWSLGGSTYKEPVTQNLNVVILSKLSNE